MSPYTSNDPFAVLAHIRKDSPPTAEGIAKQAGSLPALSSDEKDNFIRGVIEAFDPSASPAMQKFIINTVANLSTLGLQADRALVNLEWQLKEVVVTADGSTAQTLRAVLAQVKEVRQNFRRLIWDSRRVSGKAEATVKDFGSDFLSYISDELPKDQQEKKEEIQERSGDIQTYFTVLDKQQKDNQGFTDQLNNFPDDLKKCSDAFQAHSGVDDALKGLCSKVASINSQIQGVHDALSKTPWATTEGGVGELLRVLLGGGSVYASLGVVLPVAGYIKANTGSGLLASHGGALLQLYDERETVLTEIEKQQLHLTPIQAVQASLFTVSERAKDYVKNLNLLTQTLDIIRKDLDATLNAWSHDQQPAYLQTKQSIYTALTEILKLYQTDVRLPQQ